MRIARSIYDALFSGIPHWRWCWLLPIATTVIVVELGIASRKAIAQFSPCESPNPGEVLLLVEGETPEAREQVQQAIPPALSATTCILNEDEVITRISGFPSVAVANAWADYMASTTGLAAAVTRPGSLEVATGLEVAPDALPDLADPGGSQSPTPADNSRNLQPVASRTSPEPPSGYDPRILGDGYAVLVDFNRRPETALQVRQLVNREVGLAAFGQRHYLLAAYTTNQQEANAVLQTLSDRGFLAILVDSRRVTVLAPRVDYPEL